MLARQTLGQRESQVQRALYPGHITLGRKPCQSVRQTSGTGAPQSGAAAAKPVPPQFDPLYLFHCAVEWHKKGETAAGWDLVKAMQSNDRGARALAAELLAETENGRLRVRDLRKTRRGLHDISVSADGQLRFTNHAHTEARKMNTPYGLQMAENCDTCRLKKTGWF